MSLPPPFFLLFCFLLLVHCRTLPLEQTWQSPEICSNCSLCQTECGPAVNLPPPPPSPPYVPDWASPPPPPQPPPEITGGGWPVNCPPTTVVQCCPPPPAPPAPMFGYPGGAVPYYNYSGSRLASSTAKFALCVGWGLYLGTWF